MPEGGTLVLVVGPSGAGKDTLIDRARQSFAGQPVRFARRIVTRDASAAEAHDTLDRASFAAALERGRFAFAWQAHGLDYAISVAVEEQLAAGESVVCNVSRGVVQALRWRYPKVVVVFVDAPLAVRRLRVAGRRRGAETPDRAWRDQPFTLAEADVVVDNGGDLADAVDAFETVLRSTL